MVTLDDDAFDLIKRDRVRSPVVQATWFSAMRALQSAARVDHRQDLSPGERPSGEPARAIDALEERRLGVGQPAGLQIGVQVGFRQVVRRHVVPLPALFVEPQPPASALREVVAAPHAGDGAERAKLSWCQRPSGPQGEGQANRR